MKEQIEAALEEIRPYIEMHAGDIEFVKFEEGIAYVKMKGTCGHCTLSQITLKAGVENLLKERIEGIVGVEAV